MLQKSCASEPTLVAHRGASAVYPENSIAAMKEAINVAMLHPNLPFFIEADVRLSRDGVLVCHHDAQLTRMSGAAEFVNEMDAAQLQTLPLKEHPKIYTKTAQKPTPHAQCFYPVTPSDYRIATLNEVTALIEKANHVRATHGTPIGLALEIKPLPLAKNATLDMAGRAIIGALRMLGMAGLFARQLQPNPSAPALAAFLNDDRNHQSKTPMMVFSTGSLGERDIGALNTMLTGDAQQWLHQYDETLAFRTSQFEAASDADKNLFERVKHRAASALMPFTYIGSHLSSEALCRHHNTEDGLTYYQAPSQLLEVVNNPNKIERAITSGVDIIASDNPALLAEMMQSHAKQMVQAETHAAPQQAISHQVNPVQRTKAAPQPEISAIEHRAKLAQSLEPRIENER